MQLGEMAWKLTYSEQKQFGFSNEECSTKNAAAGSQLTSILPESPNLRDLSPHFNQVKSKNKME